MSSNSKRSIRGPGRDFCPPLRGQKQLSALLLAASLVFGIAATAHAEDAEKKAEPAAEGTSAADSKPVRTLEGGVRGTVLLLDEGLAKINIAREMVQESTGKIMKEATRKDTIVVRGPNAIGNGIIIPAIGGSGGVMQFGEMPIRRDKLLRFLAESEQTLAALQSYVDALGIPTDKTESWGTIHGAMRLTMQDAQDHLAKLKDLSAQKKLANGKIGREALKIYDAMGQLEKQRAQLLEAANSVTAVTEPDAPQNNK